MRILVNPWLKHQDDRGSPLSIFSVHVSSDKKRIATGGLDGNVKVWSFPAFFKQEDEREFSDEASDIVSNTENDANAINGTDNNTANNGNEHKLLASMSAHTGSVITVRFSPDGRYLASGSDDRIIIVWQLQHDAPVMSNFGGETSVESWKVLRRLVGHENDIQDLCWTPNSEYLISCGLDSTVIIWSATTFEAVKRLSAHKSHVKGVTVDPANKYFATQSDDRTMKIWRLGDFHLEKSINAPFENSPLTTYFRRPSWSPDGAVIAAANSTNGPVCSVALVDRGTWESKLSLIGHESPVEACQFSPVLFLIQNDADEDVEDTANEDTSEVLDANEGGAPEHPAEDNDIANSNHVNNDKLNNNFQSILACAGSDRTLSIWSSENPRPLVVIADICNKSIADLCWTSDGCALLLCSYDGSVIGIEFEKDELGEPVSEAKRLEMLGKYGFERQGADLPETRTQIAIEKESIYAKDFEGDKETAYSADDDDNNDDDDVEMNTDPSPPENSKGSQITQSNTEDDDDNNGEDEDHALAAACVLDSPMAEVKPKNEPLIPKETTVALDSNAKASEQVYNTGQSKNLNQKMTITKDGRKRIQPTLVGGYGDGVNSEQFAGKSPISNGTNRSNIPISIANESRMMMFGSNANVEPLEFSKASHQLPREGVQILNKTSQLSASWTRPALVPPQIVWSNIRLAVPVIRGKILNYSSSTPVEDSKKMTIDIRNGSSNEPSRVTVTRASATLWTDFLPTNVVLATGTESLWALACEDSTVILYSCNGRRLRPPLVIDSIVSFLEAENDFVMAITVQGLVYVWNTAKLTSKMAGVSLAPILNAKTFITQTNSNNSSSSSNNAMSGSISMAGVTCKGDPIITLKSGFAFTYDTGLSVWTIIASPWWAYGSQYWNSSENRGNMQMTNGTQNFIGYSENCVSRDLLTSGRGRFLQRIVKGVLFKAGYESFETSVSIAHLESRLAAAIVLKSYDELKHYAALYAERLAQEGDLAKLDELLLLSLKFEAAAASSSSSDKDNFDDENVDKQQTTSLFEVVVENLANHRQVQRLVEQYVIWHKNYNLEQKMKQ